MNIQRQRLDTTPTSVIFSHPYALNAKGNHAPTKAEVSYGGDVCQDSSAQYLGGGAYQADAGNNVTRTTPPQTWMWTQEPQLVSEKSGPSSTTFATPSSIIASTTSSTRASNRATSGSSIAISIPVQTSTTVTSSNTTPLAVSTIPGFPWESIIAGLIVGLTALAIARRRMEN